MPTPPPGRGHDQADLLLLGVLGIEDRHQPAAEHHADPVAQLHDLVQLGGDEEHRRPGVALGDDLVVDELDRADVDAARRLIGDQQLSGRLNSRATMSFCWLPPDSVIVGTAPDGVRMSNSGMSSAARLAIACSLMTP